MIENDEDASQPWDESSTMPPEGDPSYSIAIHGPRSEEHLRQILQERMATKHLAHPMTAMDWEDIEKRVQDRVAREHEAIEVGTGFWKERKRLFFEKRGLKIR